MLINHLQVLGWSSKYHKPGESLGKVGWMGFYTLRDSYGISDSAKLLDEEITRLNGSTLPKTNSKSTWKWMVGILSRFLLGPGLFSGTMLVSGRVFRGQTWVSFWFSFFVEITFWISSYTILWMILFTQKETEKMIIHIFIWSNFIQHIFQLAARIIAPQRKQVQWYSTSHNHGGKPQPTTSKKTALAKLYNFHQLEHPPKTSKTVA